MPDAPSNRRPPKKFRPEPFDYHQEIELEITALTNMGHGLGRIDGWVVFVAFSLPGEKVRARVYRNDKRHSEADLVEVIEPSPHRVAPRCGLFGDCGGCQYQHFAYEQQLEWKRQQVQELLQHMAGIETDVAAVIPSPEPYGYRSKITPHFQKPRDGQIGAIGFLRYGRRQELVDVERCEIATEPINAALPAIRQRVHANAASYKKGATLLVRDAQGTIETDSNNGITERVGERSFEFLAGDFFQNNPFILETFAGYVAAQASADGARFLVDAYCGSGLFSLTAAEKFERVAGIEISESSLTWARRNAKSNGIANCEFHVGSAEEIFANIDFVRDETTVVIDPPRKGCNAEFLDQLFAFSPKRVVYVSCNPATQMRDLVQLSEAGYRLVEVQPFDLFPQTKHLECVITVSR